MEYTEGQKEQFRREFAIRRRRQFIMAIPIILIVIVIKAVKDRDDEMLFGMPASTWAPIIILIVVGAIIFSIKNWRCPACNKYLGKNMSPSFCIKCGLPLK